MIGRFVTVPPGMFGATIAVEVVVDCFDMLLVNDFNLVYRISKASSSLP